MYTKDLFMKHFIIVGYKSTPDSSLCKIWYMLGLIIQSKSLPCILEVFPTDKEKTRLMQGSANSGNLSVY